MNDVESEQVEVTKLLGVTLECKLSWSKHIDTTVAEMERSLSILKRYSALTLSTRQVLQAMVVITPRLLFSSVVRCHKKGLGKIAVGSEQESKAGP
jgi:hypothetical protein